MTQHLLFDDKPKPLPPHVITPVAAEKQRLSRQCEAILTLLRTGEPVSNRDLSLISLRFGARLKELRDAGHDIRIIERDRATGKTVYRLFA